MTRGVETPTGPLGQGLVNAADSDCTRNAMRMPALAWAAALQRRDGPTALALSPQNRTSAARAASRAGCRLKQMHLR